MEVVAAWSILVLLDRGLHLPTNAGPPGPLMIAAFGILPATAFAIQVSEAAQGWALKPGRSVSEMAPLLRLLQLVGGFLVAVVALRMLF